MGGCANEKGSIRQAIDAVSVSAILNVTKGFDLSAAYNHVFLSNSIYKNRIVYGLSGDPVYFLLGMQFRTRNFLVAANYDIQNNGDLTYVKKSNSGLEVVSKTVVYSGNGFELAGQYDYKKWRFLGGVNIKKPEQDADQLMDPGFQRHLIFYGLQYRHSKPLTIFFEGRIEDSKDANGLQLPDANMVGLRINL
jgi:predicted porin